ncbi:unnamed protein product [Clonostachys byssicola]|uniref:Uncharacterized protein n=1 Tax=Clonostachys byssicola TaxID=160290 RepID=A0A9N9XYA7_9HYPO|nr:unnamed protein product [Clonostachys byssicola]
MATAIKEQSSCRKREISVREGGADCKDCSNHLLVFAGLTFMGTNLPGAKTVSEIYQAAFIN